MSITRAFTTRRVKQSLELRDAAEGLVSRSNTSSKSNSRTPKPLSSIRNKISAPVELVSTTNMLSYNAPDIYPKATTATPGTPKSDDDSDASTASTPPTSPDSPHPTKRMPSLEPNHLSCYFTAPGQPINAPVTGDAPAIPQRAVSHTKKNSQEALVRQRSSSRSSEQLSRTLSSKPSFSFSRSSSASTTTSATSQASSGVAKIPPPVSLTSSPAVAAAASSSPAVPVAHKTESSISRHPFGHELAQVSELAEEYSPKESSSFSMLEEREILRQGLHKFSPQDYLAEVEDLYAVFFGEAKPSSPMWI